MRSSTVWMWSRPQGDASFITVSDAPSTIIGLRVVGCTRPFSMKTQEKQVSIQRKGIVTGKDPMGLAAASLYVACVLEEEKKTQKEIAEVANVTEVTVRNRY